MADDDEMIDPDDPATELEDGNEVEVEPAELDEDDLAEDDLVEDGLVEDDEFAAEPDDEFVADEEEDTATESDGPVRKSVSAEDEDDDDDMLAPDDVEADLDTILKDRLIAAEDDDDEDEEPEERGDAGDRLQPKRADEKLCPSCFLLVRQNAPGCPVGDDECPLFKS